MGTSSTVDASAQPLPAPSATPGAGVASVPSVERACAAQSPRERSPRRVSVPVASSALSSGSLEAARGFPDGCIARVSNLQSRPELVDTRCRVLGFDPASGRYRISIEDTGECVRVRPAALRECLFAQQFRDGPTA